MNEPWIAPIRWRRVVVRSARLLAAIGLALAAGCRSVDRDVPVNVGHVYGAETAPVTVYEFSDFGCPFCRMFAITTFPELRRDYVDTGLVRWIYVPIVTGSFRNGDEAARAGECA